MTLLRKSTDERLIPFDSDSSPVFNSPFYTHPDFSKKGLRENCVCQGEVYSHQELGERGDNTNVERSKLSLISLPPSSIPYPYLLDLLWVGGPSREDIIRLYKEVQE